MENWKRGDSLILHIGDNISIIEKDIIAIINKSSLVNSKNNIKLINSLIENGNLVNRIDDKTKSYIIVSENNGKNNTNKKEKLKLYVSNISSSSLLKRQKDLDRRETNV